MTLTIKCEMSLWDWARNHSWAGGRNRLQHLSPMEIDDLGLYLSDLAEEWNEVTLNDYFWFEFDTDEQMLANIGLTSESFDKRWEEEPIWN